MPTAYHGRFAPSPTGRLHFGSLVVALGSCLEARTRKGLWSVRIENVDRTREVPHAAEEILRTLEAFGFEWDGPVMVQSERTAAYEAALERLRAEGRAYDCSCSRSEIQSAVREADTPVDELRYPGTCRPAPRYPERPLAVRFYVPPGTVSFEDAIQGTISMDVSRDSGDFVIRRRDGYFAYQLAVVVDDAASGVTDVVRGADLLWNTPRQLLLQDALGLPTPRYAHLPLVVDEVGRKLSKSTQSIAIEATQAGSILWQALDCLLQAPPVELQRAAPREIWHWSLAHWSLSPLWGHRLRPAPQP